MTLASASYMMDFVKDSLILAELSLSQGGITLLMTQSTSFINGVSLYIHIEKQSSLQKHKLDLFEFICRLSFIYWEA